MFHLSKKGLMMFVIGWLILPLSAEEPGTGIIKGKVLDKENRQAIIGATVYIKSIEKGVVTDSMGGFEFSHLKSESYSLTVHFLGYETQTIHDVHVIANKTNYREIELQASTMRLGLVEVRAARYENNRLQPVSLFSFSREEINLNPGAQGDIFRAIGMLPGVSSSGGIYSAIAVRGQGVRDNVYMVDEIPLTEVGHLEGNSFFNDPNGGRFSIFAPRVIDNARFQGGGFGPEYGRRSASYLGLSIKEGNKVNGVIDGQIDLLGINVNYDGPLKKLKNTTLFASARYQNFIGLVNVIGLKDIGLPIYADFIVKSTTQLNPKNKLNILAISSPESFVRDIDNVYADKKLNLLYLPNFKRNKTVIGLNLHTLLSKKNSWKNILYYSAYTSNVRVGKAYPQVDSLGALLTPLIPFNSQLQTQDYAEQKLGYRSVYSHTLSKNSKINAGIEGDLLHLYNQRQFHGNDTQFVYRASDLNTPTQRFQVIYPEMVNATFNDLSINYSAFANYSFLLGRKISINTGLRYDYTGFSNQHAVSPRISGSYYINEKQSLNIGTGVYFQDPVYSDIADQTEGNKLKMEKVSQLILGYRSFIRPDLSFTIETWYKNFDNLVVTPISGTVAKNNNGSGWGQGIDVNLNKKLVNKIHGIIGYSYIEIKRNDNDGWGVYNFAFSQPHQFNLMVSYKHNHSWTFAMKYRYATGKPKDQYEIHENVLNNPNSMRYAKELIGKNTSRLPDFSSIDIRVNYHFFLKNARLTGFFDVVNIMNRQIANSESFNYLTGQNYFDGLAIFPTGGLKFEF